MVLVATDTLVVDQQGAPSQFTTKAHVVPHLRTIIAGTGVAGFSTRWFARVNDFLVVRGIEHLDSHAARLLPDTYARYVEEFSIPEHLTTTIYHFGVSEITDEAVGFAYRSGTGFASERLPRGMRLKPGIDGPWPDIEDPHKLFIETMKLQRLHQESKPSDERLHIGGEIQFVHLDADTCTIKTIHRFDDFDETQAAIYRNFPG